MEELFSAIETGSIDKVKEVIANKAVSPTACSEVSSTVSLYCSHRHKNQGGRGASAPPSFWCPSIGI